MKDWLPALSDFYPPFRSGVVEFPVHHMRGGTSTGLVIWERFAPEDRLAREELLRHLMGVPLTGHSSTNRQITGLGRGVATSNKVFFADVEHVNNAFQLTSTLAQLASTHGEIDWSVNCGNMSSSLQLWALDTGLVGAGTIPDNPEIVIRNSNTGIMTTSRMMRQANGQFICSQIPGVEGTFPRVDLFLHDPVGAKTGQLLPTGAVMDDIAGYPVSCVDVAVPMVIVDATELGKTAHESIHDLEEDSHFIRVLRQLWVEAGLRMQLKHRNGKPISADELARSETIPKVCIIGAPRAGGNLAVRYFTPQTGHASMAVSGGCCLAAAALIPGTVAHRVAHGLAHLTTEFSDIEVGIENPAGILNTIIVARRDENEICIRHAAYRRNTQILLRGYVPLYRISKALDSALSRIIAR